MILLISADDDTMTDAICLCLSHLKKQFIRLNENQVITAVFFDFDKNIYKIQVGKEIHDLNEFKSVYYRNGSLMYGGFSEDIDDHLLTFFNSELKSITHFIYYFLTQSGAKVYGNIIKSHVNKLEVLHIAQSLNFKIPNTYIFSHLKDIMSLDLSKEYITKSISEVSHIIFENELYMNYTREINFNNLKLHRQNIIPSLIQKKIKKTYEVRVFFFQKKIWSIAMFEFSDEVDIRNSSINNKKYLPLKLPNQLCKKIHILAKRLDINCGTIDLLKADDDYYFLEINPLGQFHTVSLYGGYQIDKYIADLL